MYSQQAQRLVQGGTALVTGAGGSIGSELVRQLSVLGAAKVVCVDRDEYALYRLQLGLTGQAMLTDDSMVLAEADFVVAAGDRSVASAAGSTVRVRRREAAAFARRVAS